MLRRSAVDTCCPITSSTTLDIHVPYHYITTMTQVLLSADDAKQYVPDGWFSLVQRLYNALPYFQDYYEKTVDPEIVRSYPTLSVTSVGHKNGKFEANFNFPFPPLMDFVRELSEDAQWTCTLCGSASECLAPETKCARSKKK